MHRDKRVLQKNVQKGELLSVTDKRAVQQEGKGRRLCVAEGEEYLKDADKTLVPLLERYGPCTLEVRTDYFAVLCESIVSQQLSVKAADTIYLRFCSLFGGNEPEPRRLMAMDDDTIRTTGISRPKLVYLKDLAQGFVSGAIDPNGFESMEDEEIIKALTSVKGIGRWTAEMFLIFALCRSDVLPVDDLGLRKAVQSEYNLEEMPGADTIREIARDWHPYATLATWYLWRSRNNK